MTGSLRRRIGLSKPFNHHARLSDVNGIHRVFAISYKQVNFPQYANACSQALFCY